LLPVTLDYLVFPAGNQIPGAIMVMMAILLQLRSLGLPLALRLEVSTFIDLLFSCSFLVAGDIIGCGIDFTTHKAFFTKNGTLIGELVLYPSATNVVTTFTRFRF
jgi:hypothetical protein